MMGETLFVTLRGVTFIGDDFDSLSPFEDTPKELLAQFNLHQEFLCQCKLVVRIPVTIVEHDCESVVDLEATIELGDFSQNVGLDHESVGLQLTYAGVKFTSSGTSGWFEDEMLEIQRKLPEGTYMRNCLNCAYSDYSPYGHGLFGCMLCFRNLKEEYMRVKSKEDFWGVHDRYDRFVQETYVCDEFSKRPVGTGYRG